MASKKKQHSAARGVKKAPPFPFVLEMLHARHPETKPMFGALGVYVNGRIVFILRSKESLPRDNGVWLATRPEHHASLKIEFPSMRSIEMFSDDGTPSGWQNLPADAADFETMAEHACELVLRSDPRIGKDRTRERSASPKKRPKAKKR
jgi:hypothetical protein